MIVFTPKTADWNVPPLTDRVGTSVAPKVSVSWPVVASAFTVCVLYGEESVTAEPGAKGQEVAVRVAVAGALDVDDGETVIVVLTEQLVGTALVVGAVVAVVAAPAEPGMAMVSAEAPSTKIAATLPILFRTNASSLIGYRWSGTLPRQ